MPQESVYNKRRFSGVPAPITEPDSDSDFNPGKCIPEAKPKPRARQRKGRGTFSQSSTSDKGRRAQLIRALGVHNPLAQYFDKSLGLHSASEDEGSGSSGEHEEAFSEKELEGPTPSPPSASTAVRQTVHSKQKQWTPDTPWNPPDDGESSKTESESSDEHSRYASTKRARTVDDSRKSPAKRLKRTVPSGDSSVTEPESDYEVPKGGRQTSKEIDSETESESDGETRYSITEALQARPNFSLGHKQKKLGPLILDSETSTKVPGSINTFLRDYQREGVRFLWKCYSANRGGWLGDDMGLGKTIQVISFLSAIMRKEGDKRDIQRRHLYVSSLQDQRAWKKHRTLPAANSKFATCLIITPSSVLHNWERELEKWGHFEVGIYSGPHRRDILKEFKMGRLDIMLASFDIALRDIELLDNLALSVVIVDEAHRLKNPRSKLASAFHRFECVRRFGLSGTVIQNRYEEMFTTLDWTNPGRLGDMKAWTGYIVRPLKEGQSTAATEAQKDRAHNVALTLRDKILPQFFLRRTKEIIRDQMPQKVDLVVFCPLTAKQVEVYEMILRTPAVQNMILKDERCECGSKLKRKECCYPFQKADIFTYITVLIKISNHLALILPSPSDTVEQVERNRELSTLAFPNAEPPKFELAMMSSHFCGKWAILNKLLDHWRTEGGNKVLIFTKSVKLLDMLEYHLKRQSPNSFVVLKGSVKSEDRMPLIDRFQDDPEISVFLISTLSGGTGLNLTAANKVVIFDPNWNPAHDLQAMDRAYRIGQARDVHVYRLLGSGSVEELIYARQVYKQQQMQIGYTASLQTRYFSGVQGDMTKQGELFGLKNIFKLHKMDTIATKEIIEKAHLAEFSWALANMKGSQDPKKAAGDSAIRAKSDQDFSGLEALLLDDSVPSEDLLQSKADHILSQTGIQYTHNNDQLLQPSKAEEHRLVAAKEKRKRTNTAPRGGRKSTQLPSEVVEPIGVWPPVRNRKKTPADALKSREKALVLLGLIETHADLPTFALKFNSMSEKEREETIQKLDSAADGLL